MNLRVKYSLLFLAFGIATYLSTKLWNIVPYGSVWNPVTLIFSLLLGLSTLLLFVKIFTPKEHIFSILINFLIGFF
jgi:hypothetical protein